MAFNLAMAFLSVAEAKDKLSVVLPIDDLEARHCRVRYRIDEDKHQVVVDVAARSDIYDPGRA